MAFIFKPSLQHIAVVKLISTLIKQVDILYIRNGMAFPIEYNACYTQKIENEVFEIVSNSQLPKSLKRKILDVVRPMISEITHWKNNNTDLRVMVWMCDYLCWTSEGTVDYKKTAEELSRDDKLDITERYDLACRYCLESDIGKLWDRLSEFQKKDLIEQSAYEELYHYDFSIHWALRMKEVYEDDKITIPIHYSWQSALKYARNAAAIEYCLNKLTPAEKEQSVITQYFEAISPSISIRDLTIFQVSKRSSRTLLFLLTQMSEELQKEMIQKFPYTFLQCLLQWPRQYIFSESVNKLCDFLSLKEYLRLILLNLDMFCFINTPRNENYDCKELFRKFWQQSPTSKKYVFNNGESRMLKVIKKIDENQIKSVLKDDAPEEKKELDLEHVNQFILNLIKNDEWLLLTSIFQDCQTREIKDCLENEFNRELK